MSSLTVVQCRALLDRDQAFQTSTGDVDSDLFLDFINEIEDIFYDILIQASPRRFLKATSISTGTNPTTVSDLYKLDVQGGGVFDANSDGTITDHLVRVTNRGSNATGYWTEDQDAEGGAKLNFTPSTVGSNTKWVVYIPYRTILAAGSTTLFPSLKAHFIKRALLRAYFLWDRNAGLNIADANFLDALRQIIHNSNPQAENADLDLTSY